MTLKEWRKSKKLSQNALAKALRVSRQSVIFWETGRFFPKLSTALFIVKYTKGEVGLADLFGMRSKEELDQLKSLQKVKID